VLILTQEDSGCPLQAHCTNSLHSISTNEDAAAEKSAAARASAVSNSNESEDQMVTTAEVSTAAAKASDESEDVSNSNESEDALSIVGDSDVGETNIQGTTVFKNKCGKSDKVSSESILAAFYVVI